MISKDYHGFYAADALSDVETIIGRVRLSRRREYAEFITGFGVIREQLFDLLQKYSLNPTYKLNNPGTIVVDIE